MEKLTRTYLNRISDYHTARNILTFLMIFSVLNIGIYYLSLVPFVSRIMELFDLDGYLAPAASLPKELLVRYIESGKWLLGVAFALLALLPYGVSLLITADFGRGRERFRGWGFLPCVLWYLVDTGLHIYGVVLSLIEDFAVMVIIWEVIGLLFRVFVFAFIIDGIFIPRQIKKTREKLIANMIVQYTLANGPEEAKKLQREDYEKMTDRYINRVRVAAYNASIDAMAESL